MKLIETHKIYEGNWMRIASIIGKARSPEEIRRRFNKLKPVASDIYGKKEPSA